ncbi:MAG: hypothetical protein PHY43_11130 [Verrucomicrobiales bacterium]|nr:hypothetical protein [Verrucomicrobiales bacterium]
MRDQSSRQETTADASHSHALQSFERRLVRLLAVRNAVQWMTLWFFIWGVGVLAMRIAGVTQTEWLGLGLFGIAPLFILAVLHARRQKPDFTKIRASYDQVTACGGVMMAEEAADMSVWQSQMPPALTPRLRWDSGRMMTLLCISALFVATALLLPERLTNLTHHHSLEIGQIVEQLQAEVQTLAQEKILEVKKADELEQQLASMKKDSSGLDPNKTWEALDHMKEANADLAKQAAEEALNKTAELTQAQTLANAMQEAAESGMSQDTATQAAQTLAGMIKAAKLEEGLLNGEIPPELLTDLSGLNKEQMEKLMSALQFNKDALGKTLGKLAALKMIDPTMLGKCTSAGLCKNPGALADFLSSCTNGAEATDLMMSYCRGGVSRGRGDAMMTWKDESSADGAKFKEEALPASTHLSDAQFVGVSKAAPELSGQEVQAEHGALASTEGSGGSAHSQIILPEHKQAVQNFFKRDE